MMSWLPDVNILIALLDPVHVHHLRARQWFEESGQNGWHTCPTTINGVVRVMSGRSYSDRQIVPPSQIMTSLEALVQLGKHTYLPDDVTMIESEDLVRSALLTSKMVTDTYLMLVAKHHGVMLATFDHRLVTSTVTDGASVVAFV